MLDVSERARRLHQDALVIDGLVFESDNWLEPFKEGNVTAINMTVPNVLVDFEACCDELAALHHFLSTPESGWHLVLTADDIDTARRAGKVGLILGWQNSRPLSDRL